MIEIDRNESVTPQLFEHLRSRIAAGEWAISTPLPGVRELARQYGVSVTTIQRTLAKLEARQLIETSPGRKSIVKAHRSRVVRGKIQPGAHIAVVREVASPDDVQKRAAGWGGCIGAAAEAVFHQRSLQPVTAFYTLDDEDVVPRLSEQFDLMGDKLAGVICFPGHCHQSMAEFLEQRGLPFVTINRLDVSSVHNFVTADYTDAGRRIGRCFAEMGSHRMLLVGDRFDASVSWHELCTGIVQNLLAHGVPLGGVMSVHVSGSSEPSGYEAVARFLGENDPPQVIVAAGDYFALGAMRACRERNLSIPDQVQIIGGAGLDVAEFASPPLSVIAQPVTQIGTEAAVMLLEMLETGQRRLPGRVLPTPIIARGTTSIPESLRPLLEGADAPSSQSANL